jgi:hypothetical protein
MSVHEFAQAETFVIALTARGGLPAPERRANSTLHAAAIHRARATLSAPHRPATNRLVPMVNDELPVTLIV